MSNGYDQKAYGNGVSAARFRRPRRKICAFCADPDATIDYKNASRLRRYMSDRGKILPRRQSGNCAKHQRKVAAAIKRARDLALLPYVAD